MWSNQSKGIKGISQNSNLKLESVMAGKAIIKKETNTGNSFGFKE
jgi:hypothetical protein